MRCITPTVLFIAVALVACVHAEALRSWTLVDLPSGSPSPQWLATWPGVRGVMLVSADNTSTVHNAVQVRRIIDGHDRMTGLTVWRDSNLGTGDLLVYVNSFDDHRVWRYQVDPTTWEVRGQLQMLSPQHPLGLALSADGDSICVSGDTGNGEIRVAQCYRISRALSDDGVTIDEWWVMMSNFQWTGAATDPTRPRAEALLYDSNALPTEASRAGSLWIDCKHQPGQLVRFPVDSITGAFMPAFLALPGSLDAQRLTWTAVADGSHLLVTADSAYKVTWSSDTGAAGVSAATPLWLTTTTHDHLRAVVWRHTALDSFQRLDLALLGASTAVEFNLLDEAVQSGEVSQSSSLTPSVSRTPSSVPSATRVPEASPSTTRAAYIPPPSATLNPSPVPTASTEPVVVVVVVDDPVLIVMNASTNDSEKIASSDSDDNSNDSLHGLWALTSLALPCCCVPVAVWVVWRKRRTLSRGMPARMTWLKSGQTQQPYALACASGANDGATGQWSQYYDVGDPSAVAIPTTIQHAPLLDQRQ